MGATLGPPPSHLVSPSCLFLHSSQFTVRRGCILLLRALTLLLRHVVCFINICIILGATPFIYYGVSTMSVLQPRSVHLQKLLEISAHLEMIGASTRGIGTPDFNCHSNVLYWSRIGRIATESNAESQIFTQST